MAGELSPTPCPCAEETLGIKQAHPLDHAGEKRVALLAMAMFLPDHTVFFDLM